MPERKLRSRIGGQNPNVETDHPVLGAVGVHIIRGAVERHTRPPPAATHVHTDRRPAPNGHVQRAERVQLALVTRGGRHYRVPGTSSDRIPDMLRGRRRVLRGRHHPNRGQNQAHRYAYVAVLHRYADRRVHRRLPEREHRVLRDIRRMHSDELRSITVRLRARQ